MGEEVHFTLAAIAQKPKRMLFAQLKSPEGILLTEGPLLESKEHKWSVKSSFKKSEFLRVYWRASARKCHARLVKTPLRDDIARSSK